MGSFLHHPKLWNPHLDTSHPLFHLGQIPIKERGRERGMRSPSWCHRSQFLWVPAAFGTPPTLPGVPCGRKLGDGLFLQCCKEVAELYPKIKFDTMIIDNCCMQVSHAPGVSPPLLPEGLQPPDLGTPGLSPCQAGALPEFPICPTFPAGPCSACGAIPVLLQGGIWGSCSITGAGRVHIPKNSPSNP